LGKPPLIIPHTHTQALTTVDNLDVVECSFCSFVYLRHQDRHLFLFGSCHDIKCLLAGRHSVNICEQRKGKRQAEMQLPAQDP
jgi:hypothetical protein